MSARLLVGSGFPGEWVGAGILNSFRCGTSRSESEALLGGNMPAQPPGKGNGKGKGLGKGAGSVPPREPNYPGGFSLGPQFSTAPTFSEPRSRKRQKPAASGALVSQEEILPRLVGFLSNLGRSQEILNLVQSKVEKVRTTAKPVPGEKEMMLYVLKAKLDKAAAHLEHLRSIERKKELDYAKAREEVIALEAAVEDLHAQREQSKQKVMVGSTAGSDLGEQWDESDRSEVMSDVDSDLAPADWAVPSDTPNATPSASAFADPTLRTPPPPAHVTQLRDKVHCDETGRMKVLSWDLDSVQQMHAWCRERLNAVVDGATSSGWPTSRGWDRCWLPGGTCMLWSKKRSRQSFLMRKAERWCKGTTRGSAQDQ